MTLYPFSLEKYNSDYFLKNFHIISKGGMFQAVKCSDSPKNIFEHIVHVVRRIYALVKNKSSSIIRISRELICKCDEKKFESLKKDEIKIILRNLAVFNAKIHHHNKKVWLPFLRAPVLDTQVKKLQNLFQKKNDALIQAAAEVRSKQEMKLNHNVQQLLFFPKESEYLKLSENQVLKGWERNNAILIGLIASKSIPSLGFSGQEASGLEKILITHCSGSNSAGKYMWVAGYNYQLDPITFLADLTVLARCAKRYGYDEKNTGGVLFLNTKGAHVHSEKICGGFEPVVLQKGKTVEGPLAIKFLRLTTRKKGSTVAQYATFPKKGSVSTLRVPTTNEIKLRFVEKDYKERVYGVITNDEFIYPDHFVSQLYEMTHIRNVKSKLEQDRNYTLFKFADRFNCQQIILHAFEKIGLLYDFKTKSDAEKFYKIGTDLMSKIDETTMITAAKLKEVAGNHWGTKESDYNL